MPHVLVKLATGHSEERKQALSSRMVEALVSTIGCGEDEISVAIKETPKEEWIDRVYASEIEPNLDRLYKKPGYGRTP